MKNYLTFFALDNLKRGLSIIRFVATLLLIFLFQLKDGKSQSFHFFSITFTPALSGVNVNNFEDFSINSYTKQLYTTKKANAPSYGYAIGLNYRYYFHNNWSIGLGLLKSEKRSHSGEFYLSPTSKSKVIYEHKYSSIEIPFYVGYAFNRKKVSPIVAIESSVDVFRKFEMPVYSINSQTGMQSNFLTETHFGVKWSLLKFGTGVMAGVKLNIIKSISFSISPEFRYYFHSYRLTSCANCSSYIEGNMWLLGLRTELGVKF